MSYHNQDSFAECEDCGLESRLYGGLCEDCDGEMFATFWTGENE